MVVKSISNFVSDIKSLLSKSFRKHYLLKITLILLAFFYVHDYKNTNILSLQFPGLVCMWYFVYRGILSENVFNMTFQKRTFRCTILLIDLGRDVAIVKSARKWTENWIEK